MVKEHDNNKQGLSLTMRTQTRTRFAIVFLLFTFLTNFHFFLFWDFFNFQFFEPLALKPAKTPTSSLVTTQTPFVPRHASHPFPVDYPTVDYASLLGQRPSRIERTRSLDEAKTTTSKVFLDVPSTRVSLVYVRTTWSSLLRKEVYNFASRLSKKLVTETNQNVFVVFP